MSTLFDIADRLDAARMCRAEITTVLKDGRLVVRLDGEDREVTCDVLVTSRAALRWAAGEQALVWLPPVGATAVVLGRVGPRQSSKPSTRPDDECPDTIVLEAKQSLTLRVGAGSITIREDGKILIKGKDLVSHAQGMNRIKGGAVAIN